MSRRQRELTAGQDSKADETLRVTPAIEAGLTDHVWTIEELISQP
jgi:hypothetical protein